MLLKDKMLFCDISVIDTLMNFYSNASPYCILQWHLLLNVQHSGIFCKQSFFIDIIYNYLLSVCRWSFCFIIGVSYRFYSGGQNYWGHNSSIPWLLPLWYKRRFFKNAEIGKWNAIRYFTERRQREILHNIRRQCTCRLIQERSADAVLGPWTYSWETEINQLKIALELEDLRKGLLSRTMRVGTVLSSLHFWSSEAHFEILTHRSYR